MSYKINKCPLCDSNKLHNLDNKLRNLSTYQVIKCKNCELLFLDKIYYTSQEQLDELYEEMYSEEYYKDGKNEGTWVHYHDNGQLWTSESWKDGRQSGLSITYWDNGTIRSKGTYKNGKREGSWTSYWKNGEISEWETGEFKNGLRIGN